MNVEGKTVTETSSYITWPKPDRPIRCEVVDTDGKVLPELVELRKEDAEADQAHVPIVRWIPQHRAYMVVQGKLTKDQVDWLSRKSRASLTE